VGRFDSHWMKVPRWMLAPLYGYALIQMIYVFFFNLPPEWQGLLPGKTNRTKRRNESLSSDHED
jgi:hypothetical protein